MHSTGVLGKSQPARASSTFRNEFFKDTYPEIEFVNPGTNVDGLYAMFNIGWYYFENGEIDYAKISLYAAQRVEQFLNVPVSLVTDSKNWLLQSQPAAKVVFDRIITINSDTSQTKKFYDGTLSGKTLTWKNLSRSDCYDLTPYDETLVIDSDYIISSNTLAGIWNNVNDFLIYQPLFSSLKRFLG